MNDSNEQAQQRIADRAKRDFDETVERLDAATLSRLNRGRQAALAQFGAPKRTWLQWMPATGLAAAVLIAVVTFRGAGEIDVLQAPASDFEILLSEESIEMFEDLEFYSWLATQELEGDSDLG